MSQKAEFNFILFAIIQDEKKVGAENACPKWIKFF